MKQQRDAALALASIVFVLWLLVRLEVPYVKFLVVGILFAIAFYFVVVTVGLIRIALLELLRRNRQRSSDTN